MRKTDNLIGESEAFLTVLDQTSRLAPLDRPILIIGERGTGKELIAQRLHYLSRRWDQPLGLAKLRRAERGGNRFRAVWP